MFLAASLAKVQRLCLFYNLDVLPCRAVRRWIPAKDMRE
jgi:hypothetical protein